MRKFNLFSEGYIDAVTEFEYKHINNHREVFPLLHDHDYYEFFIVLDGEIDHFVNNESFQLERGHMLFIRPSDFHYINSTPNKKCHFINLAILERTIKDLFCYLGSGLDKEKLLKPEFPPTVLLTSGELQKLVARLEKLNTLPVNDKKRLNTELRVILVQLLSDYFINEIEEKDDYPEWLNETLDRLQEPECFLSGLPRVKEIACKSDEHLSRSFKKYLKKTPTQYINEQRLNFAANQIRFTSKKIAEICFESGFDNQSNFHRQFKNLFNYTPNQFRKIHWKQENIA